MAAAGAGWGAVERWRELVATAERRHGIVAQDDLLAAGLSESRLARWSTDGRLVHVAHGVYRLGGVAPSFDGEVLAAIVVFRHLTWASHGTTLRLSDVHLSRRAARIELTRPVLLSAQRSIARVHRSTLLPDHHLTEIRGIPSVTPSRAVFDVARTTGDLALRRAIDRCLMKGLCTMGSLYVVLYDLGGRGRPGTRRMRASLEHLGRGYVPPESELEIVGWSLLDGLGFERQVELADEQGYIRRVDGLHRPGRLVVELDGAQHRREPQLTLDREQDRRLARLGLSVIRLGWADVTVDGLATRDAVAARLA